MFLVQFGGSNVSRLVPLALLASTTASGQPPVSRQTPLYGLTIRTCCRAIGVVVVDPEGRKTGVEPGSGRMDRQIPRSTYSANTGIDDDGTGQADPDPGKEVEIMGPRVGGYGMQLAAAEGSRYSLEVRAFDQQPPRDAGRALTGIRIAKGAIHRYRLLYDRTPSALQLALSGQLPGSGGEPEDADRLPTYAAPAENRVTLDPNTGSVELTIVYDPQVMPATFVALLNGADATRRFHPAPVTVETVEIPLQPGRNTLTLSIASETGGKDSDELTFTVGS